jgi:hypothetical protein
LLSGLVPLHAVPGHFGVVSGRESIFEVLECVLKNLFLFFFFLLQFQSL